MLAESEVNSVPRAKGMEVYIRIARYMRDR